MELSTFIEAALERLQQILFFRELDFRLKEIKEIMENPEYDKQEVFRKQKKNDPGKEGQADQAAEAVG